jgi:hypothetical protein
LPETIFMKISVYIMAPESISKAYFIDLSITLCFYMYIPLSLLGNGSVKTLPR